jgi:hypothetical protein
MQPPSKGEWQLRWRYLTSPGGACPSG